MKLARQDEAVSPVIGTILMVAITVVLAATAFLLFRGLAEKGTDSAPVMAFEKDELNDGLRVVRIDPGITTDHISVRMSVPGDLEMDNAVSAGADALPLNVFEPLGGAAGGPAAQVFEPGTTLHLCAEPAASDVHVVLRDDVSNRILWDGMFLNLADCPA